MAFKRTSFSQLKVKKSATVRRTQKRRNEEIATIRAQLNLSIMILRFLVGLSGMQGKNQEVLDNTKEVLRDCAFDYIARISSLTGLPTNWSIVP